MHQGSFFERELNGMCDLPWQAGPVIQSIEELLQLDGPHNSQVCYATSDNQRRTVLHGAYAVTSRGDQEEIEVGLAVSQALHKRSDRQQGIVVSESNRRGYFCDNRRGFCASQVKELSNIHLG